MVKSVIRPPEDAILLTPAQMAKRPQSSRHDHSWRLRRPIRSGRKTPK
jgi:hypothetical protein